ncbi:N-acetylmuramoyl-L-alanine amidase [Bacillus sp. RAR_GA_16]|uniref:N-acetylmuramoyl-L-alanine amidase n=1 Tax=Bacillus sp. RAR_GA_16 TaxID=2876774 RepID=UPI001CCA3D05|nr:N-acetylmuramoyl-L-alanine amidase [Bacillus sp. RAR_GA_16]MCA0173364.1 N-acetylmuramoyl-L-alanine amidase [Bacillus sp. RAR_GA_16]
MEKIPGAIANGLKEKDWNLEVSLHQYEFLKKLSIPCEITRKTDVELTPEKRSELVKSSDAIVCLSNHFNAGGGSGAEVIYSKYTTSEFAESVGNALKKAGMPIRRIFSKEGSNGNDYYYMHRLTGKVETLIIEYGFLDSATDRKKLNVRSFRFQLAEEAALAAVRYLKGDLNRPLYLVQAGAYKEKSKAEQLCEELKKKGYDAFVKYD